MSALALLHTCLASQALKQADPTSGYLEKLIEDEFCGAAGLRLKAKDIVLAPADFADHVGKHHADLSVKTRVRFNTGRINAATGKASRGYVDVKLGCGVVEVSTEMAAKDIVTVGGVQYVPRDSLYFVMYKSTLVHEFWHVLTISCGIPRFKSSVEKSRIPDETPEAYKQRYYLSDGEMISYTHQLVTVLAIRLEEKMRRMSVYPRLTRADAAERETILNGTPREMLDTAISLKILPKKLIPWVEAVYNAPAPRKSWYSILPVRMVEALERIRGDKSLAANPRQLLESEIVKLQTVLRAKYRSAVYYGA